MLAVLPAELLQLIVSYIPTARDLAALSATSQRLHKLVESDHQGWHTFTLSRFPSLQPPHPRPNWKEAAQSLTSFSRALDRRALLAAELQPRDVNFVTHGIRRDRYTKSSRQTMGYQAILDSYEDCYPGPTRREVVAWGAGADLLIRRTEHAATSTLSSTHDSAPSSRPSRDWWAYQERLYREGLHDIMTVNLLPAPHRSSDPAEDCEEALIGRANGDLDLIRIHSSGRTVLRSFTTEGAVRSTTLSSPAANLLATITGSQTLSLYSLHGADEPATAPLSTDSASSPAAATSSCARWSARFLSDSHIAVGRGPSHTLVQVYSVTPPGLSNEPIRTFPASRPPPFATTVYPIAPLSSSTTTSADDPTNLFLTGGYDGRIRLHDLRSPLPSVAELTDPIDRSAIFALAPLGRERLAAGAALNALVKLFDLRMPGARAYAYAPVPSATLSTPNASLLAPDISEEGSLTSPRGVNIFAGAPRTNRYGGHAASARAAHSPVYSLSRPSTTSPTLFIGLEGAVHSLTFSEAGDSHPGPAVVDLHSGPASRRGSGHTRRRSSASHSAPTINPSSSNASITSTSPGKAADSIPLSLSLYEQRGAREMRVLTQRPLGAPPRPAESPLAGYDGRLFEAFGRRDGPPSSGAGAGGTTGGPGERNRPAGRRGRR